jgi:hypothetical protein
MAKNKISEYSSTASNNTDIAGINIAEGCAPSGINNAIRELMAQLKDQQAGTDGDGFTVGGAFTCTGAAVFSSTVTAPTVTTGDSSTKVATTAFVQAALTAAYPVGSIYINASVGTNPATLLGFGTWIAFGAGRVMVGLDATNTAFDTVGETGGSANAVVVSHTHTGTTNSSGAHRHGLNANTGGSLAALGTQTSRLAGISSGTPGVNTSENFATSYGGANLVEEAITHTHTFTTGSTGSSGTNANLQPYITVYMWSRTA